MNTFDERKKAFEAKFLQDEDLKFKLRARRNKRIAEWAAELIGKTNDEDYIREVRESDLIKPGATALTVILYLPVSLQRALVKPAIAALEAE